MKNITDFRETLFETIEMIKSGQLGPDEGKAIAAVGRVMMESAKIEVVYVEKITQDADTGFLRPITGKPEQQKIERPKGVLSTQEKTMLKHGV